MDNEIELKECKVYVACLACYNEGKLNGQWMTADELDVAWENDWVNDVLVNGEYRDERILCDADAIDCHDEWAIHDYDMEGLVLGEHPDIPDLIALMHLIDEDADYVYAAALLHSFHGGDYDPDTVMQVKEAMGSYTCRSEWARELCEDIYHTELEALPHFISGTIDWDWVGQQLEYDYYTHEVGHTTYAIHVGDF